MPINIVIIDDHAMFRESVAEVFTQQADLKVVGQSDEGKRGVEIVDQYRPDVVLLDVEMPGPGIDEVIKGIHRVSAASKIAILTMHEDADLVGRLMDLGVHAFISKGSSLEELITVIRSIVSGQDRVVFSVSRDVLSGLRKSGRNPLSPRETEVLTLISEGFRNAQIATCLFISEGTVKRHLTNIYVKLDVESRVNAINRANELGLLRPVGFQNRTL